MSLQDLEDASGCTRAQLIEWEGVYFPCYPDIRKNLDILQQIPVRDSDTFLCGFPKSGCHWTLEVMHMLIQGKTEYYPLSHFPLAGLSHEYLETQLTTPRILAAHLHHRHAPKDLLNNAKVIYIIRNPKDVAVSLYNFCKTYQYAKFNGEWSDFLPMFLSGKVIYGNWWEHVLGWKEAAKSNPNILFVAYEDMIQNLEVEAGRIAEHLCLPRSSQFLKEVADKCNFQSVKDAKSHTRYTLFMRKGVVGDWKNYFTVAQNEMFDKVHEEYMKNSDIQVKFEI
ncbi:sulfotransferase family cytosolic 1B member 1-like [Lingula anatina]|uniref:Sulfotransferase family cytosolic 1B member 1-like n=1 Tax=Lingula anatina TaxID=7574 RepID=A0A1S3HPV9_LINAN|nr:sulfotransferase family cytosolic 1B member 1-like [Lingula anatina]XP_013388070.1 sulfotransferase family cytosolic 1B member 1-like [Lingula anatina]XP_013388071.1 sulfotransferase family cytosolic 1B member 1-like [Lingula anatina]|eukprot:XP_013388069.1 sulfotransferase family cytosolic 1B member 1-like [Lingula anatina]